MLKKLHELQIQSIIVEGGSLVLQQFIDAGLWDETIIIKNKNLFISSIYHEIASSTQAIIIAADIIEHDAKGGNLKKEARLISNHVNKIIEQTIDDLKANKNFKEGKGLENNTRPNALFLSTVAQLNGEVSNKIQNWLKTNINVISGLDDATTAYTIGRFQDQEEFRKKIINSNFY